MVTLSVLTNCTHAGCDIIFYLLQCIGIKVAHYLYQNMRLSNLTLLTSMDVQRTLSLLLIFISLSNDVSIFLVYWPFMYFLPEVFI
jgi:hypothetical protein